MKLNLIEVFLVFLQTARPHIPLNDEKLAMRNSHQEKGYDSFQTANARTSHEILNLLEGLVTYCTKYLFHGRLN